MISVCSWQEFNVSLLPFVLIQSWIENPLDIGILLTDHIIKF